MKQCKTCEKKLNVGFFNEDSGDDCVFCANSRVTLAEVKKSDDYEVVDDVGCAGEHVLFKYIMGKRSKK